MAWHVSPWIYPVWDSLCLLSLFDYFLFHVGEIFNYNLFKNVLIPFLFLFFWDFCNSNFGAFDVVPEVSETVLSSFHSFYFILLFRSYFHHFIFQLVDSFRESFAKGGFSWISVPGGFGPRCLTRAARPQWPLTGYCRGHPPPPARSRGADADYSGWNAAR